MFNTGSPTELEENKTIVQSGAWSSKANVAGRGPQTLSEGGLAGGSLLASTFTWWFIFHLDKAHMLRNSPLCPEGALYELIWPSP